jgi:hypothetical protein
MGRLPFYKCRIAEKAGCFTVTSATCQEDFGLRPWIANSVGRNGFRIVKLVVGPAL